MFRDARGAKGVIADLRASAQYIRADIPQDGQEGRGDAASGLGSGGALLLISARALTTLTGAEYRGVALLGALADAS